jgi:hypothetical protein
MKHKCNVNTTIVREDNDNQGRDGDDNDQCYDAFNLDTDISEGLAYASNMSPNNGEPDNYLPKDESNEVFIDCTVFLHEIRDSVRDTTLHKDASH